LFADVPAGISPKMMEVLLPQAPWIRRTDGPKNFRGGPGGVLG